MAALDFPTSPTLNQTYTANSTTWKWNGTSWIALPTVGGGTGLYDNTGASSDRTLLVGETAFVTFSNATSIPLAIATGNNQLYELTLMSAPSSATTNLARLNINNSSALSYIAFEQYTGTDNAAGNALSQVITTDTGFRLSIGGTPLYVTAKFATTTGFKSMLGQGRDTNATIGYAYNLQVNCTDYTTVWTSLGTIVCATGLTGTAWVKRIG